MARELIGFEEAFAIIKSRRFCANPAVWHINRLKVSCKVLTFVEFCVLVQFFHSFIKYFMFLFTFVIYFVPNQHLQYLLMSNQFQQLSASFTSYNQEVYENEENEEIEENEESNEIEIETGFEYYDYESNNNSNSNSNNSTLRLRRKFEENEEENNNSTNDINDDSNDDILQPTGRRRIDPDYTSNIESTCIYKHHHQPSSFEHVSISSSFIWGGE